MTTHSLHLPKDCDPSWLLAQLKRHNLPTFRLVAEAPTSEAVSYSDTYDWRIFHAGLVLKTTTHGRRLSLSLEDGNGPIMPRQDCRQPLAFAKDLAHGELREKLIGIADVRRLLPVASIEETSFRFRFLNEDEKTVVRGAMIVREAADKSGQQPPTLARLHGLRGYGEELAAAQELFRRAAAKPNTQSELQGLEPILLRKPHPPRDLKVHLENHEGATTSAKRVFLRLLDEIEDQKQGILDDLDIEFVHDFRVAIRRTRSVLKNFARVFPEDDRLLFNKAFADLVRPSGPVRDLDVYLQKTDHYLQGLPAETRAEFQPLIGQARISRDKAQDELAALLRKPDYLELVKNWREYLGSEDSDTHSTLPIQDLAQKRIWKAYKRLREAGDAIEDHHEVERLHELRIDAKRLRYALEAFGSLFPEGQIKPLTKKLKTLQDNLGDLQDLAVHQGLVGEHAQHLPKGKGYVKALVATGRMLAHLDALADQERDRFHGVYTAFREPAQHELYRQLFKR